MKVRNYIIFSVLSLLFSIFLSNFFLPEKVLPDKGFDNSISNISKYEKASFEMKIYLVKTYPVFIEGEIVLLKIIFKNISTKVDSIAFLNECEITRRMKVTNEQEITSSYKGLIVGYEDKSYTKFRPGEQKEFYTNINTYWGFRFYDDSVTTASIANNPYFPKGKYKIKSDFYIDIEDKMGKFTSNEISFTVNEPEGMELEAFNEMIRIYKLKFNNETSPEEMEGNVDEYMEFINKYRNSVYVDKVFSDILGIRNVCRTKFDSSFIKDCELFIRTYPNSYYINSAIYGGEYYYYYYLKDKEKAKEFLEFVKTNYTNTKASETAEEILKKEEYNNN